MKLEHKAKPVKIRIKSGGEEHSSLDSLKRNFSVEDLKPLQKDGRLSRWLRQLNENELAEKIEKIDLENLTVSSYVCFLKSFFDDLPDDISKICDYWLESLDYHKNGIKLLQFRLNDNKNCDIDEVIRLKDKYAEYSEEVNVDWIDIFKKRTDECDDETRLLNIVKIFGNEKSEKSVQYVKVLLNNLAAKGNMEAVGLLQNRQIDTEEVKEIKNLLTKFSTKKGLSDNVIDSCRRSCSSKKALVTIEFINCISNIIKGKGLISFENDDTVFHDELSFIKAMLKGKQKYDKELSLPTTGDNYHPYCRRTINYLSGIQYDKEPKIIRNIESGEYGNKLDLSLNCILGHMIEIVIEELENRTISGNNINSQSNTNSKIIDKTDEKNYCGVYVPKLSASQKGPVANMIKRYVTDDETKATIAVNSVPGVIVSNLERYVAEFLVEKMERYGVKASVKYLYNEQ